MICDNCKQNEATVKLIAIINGVKTERHLCADCVEQQKKKVHAEGMQSMLSAIIAGARSRDMRQQGLRCSSCGLSYDEFRKTSRLGCAQCYKDFRAQLKPLLMRVHGSAQHAGRIPERVDAQLRRSTEVERLRREMEVAVACEDFEQAAVLRDTLRSMSVSTEGSGHGA